MSKNLALRIISGAVLSGFCVITVLFCRTLFNISLIALCATMLFEWFRMTQTSKLTMLLGVIVIPCPIVCMLVISHLDREGIFLLTMIIIISIIDIAAMFGGKSLGGPKLAPSISPNKTISGFISAIIIASISSFLLFACPAYDLSYLLNNEINGMILSVASAILAVIAQISDLFISIFKRKFKIKDTGKLIPGHGGTLDRFDSYIFTAPLTLIFILAYHN